MIPMLLTTYALPPKTCFLFPSVPVACTILVRPFNLARKQKLLRLYSFDKHYVAISAHKIADIQVIT
jgi:hypothetical protein